MKMAGGFKENGVVVGNTYDKYKSANPCERLLVNGFVSAMTDLVDKIKPASIHEVGCGEGYWTLKWLEQGIAARGSDFSSSVIAIARANASSRTLSVAAFKVCSIYDLDPAMDSAHLVVCCEVLEHLKRLDDALQVVTALARPYLILSVPREPLWRAMNVARGKYWINSGNTPGHVQSWSRRQFLALVSRYCEVLEVRSPIPWTILLCRRREFSCDIKSVL